MKKAEEYCIKVFLSPQHNDHTYQYFWSILGFTGETWYNYSSGWEDSVEEAWQSALLASKDL